MKKIIIGLIAVFAVGVIGAVISAAASDFTKEEVKAAETYDPADIKKIEVTTSSMHAEVKSGQTDDIQVAAEGQVSDKSKKLFDVSQDGNSLTINQIARENIISFIPWGSEKDMKITITIPEKKYDEITVTTTSGDILIENTQTDQSAADSTSGNILLKQTRIENELTLKTTSGEIQTDQNSFGQGEVKTTSGSIKSSRAFFSPAAIFFCRLTRSCQSLNINLICNIGFGENLIPFPFRFFDSRISRRPSGIHPAVCRARSSSTLCQLDL